jgi:hypothetical protein
MVLVKEYLRFGSNNDEHRLSLAKHELELVIVLEVVSRPSGSIESEVDGGVARSESPWNLDAKLFLAEMQSPTI